MAIYKGKHIALVGDIHLHEGGSKYPINVDFKVEDEDYCAVGVQEGGQVSAPVNPTVEQGKFFSGWYDEETKIVFPYAPSENKVLNALIANNKILPNKITNFIVPDHEAEYIFSEGTVNWNPFTQTSGYEVDRDENRQFYKIKSNNYLSYTSDVVLRYTDPSYGCSVGGWFRFPSSSYTTNRRSFSIGKDSATFEGLTSSSSYDSTIYALGTSNKYRAETSTATETNEWFHLVWTISTDFVFKIYYNGECVYTSPNTNLCKMNTTSKQIIIGDTPWGATKNTSLDVTHFFSAPEALTEEEIQTLYSYF